MLRGLTIQVVDPDPDYLAVEIHAASERFAGSAWIYAERDGLSEFASKIDGFPVNSQDERTYEFGTREPGFAGGYCKFHLRCVDRSGHAVMDVVIADDKERYGRAAAEFTFHVEAASIDRFAAGLRTIEQERDGEAVLLAV